MLLIKSSSLQLRPDEFQLAHQLVILWLLLHQLYRIDGVVRVSIERRISLKFKDLFYHSLCRWYLLLFGRYLRLNVSHGRVLVLKELISMHQSLKRLILRELKLF